MDHNDAFIDDRPWAEKLKKNDATKREKSGYGLCVGG